ncbi:LacI family DNA-binding transcriptional regulator [Curtobacterium herbarum]|uniref:LacI family DNA-binding transcriptional regulator n=1 Tax=Curtobacterium herbarum TaxID=150122 RepID=A0ABP4K500_9MICO|nr:LacI family DNA-binding transcriptional regulator [Curtobacterium herbarum]MBM7476758.1 LacI family transcriptional regulator [Curtobacterium herbarum]MCS6545227.1 LacI family transcriptional regulator [Curtobacterium herbarum]
MPTTPRSRPAPSGRVTAAMVAERAGTSIATVSLVVNGKDRGRVSTPIADRVRDAVEQLGYVVDHAASSLARGSGDLVVLIAPDLSNPFFAEVIRGVRDTIGDRFQLVLSVTERGEQPVDADVRRFERLRPAGILVDAPAEHASMAASVPVVLLDAPGGPGAVNYDLTAGVEALVAHLAAAGHRRVAYLDGTSRATTFAVRRALFGQACVSAGISVSQLEAQADLTIDAAASAVGQVVDAWLADGVTAVVAAADTLAYGVLRVAAERGIAVPAALAVAGFDDLPSSSVTAPSLTSVALPGAELGRAAALRLLATLDGVDAPDPALPTRLVPRASTGA